MSNIRVAVAMSGGVDSSLTTLLLKEQGYDVFGITMLLSDDRRDNAMEGDIPDYNYVDYILDEYTRIKKLKDNIKAAEDYIKKVF